MKRSTLNLTLTVAALTIAAGTASAQMMKAEIPFAFRVGHTLMQPGEYQVQILSGNTGQPIVRLYSREVKQSALLLPRNQADVPRDWATDRLPRLRFACSDGPCVLNSMWTGEGQAMEFPSTRGKNGDPRIAEVVLRYERVGD